VDHDRHEDPSEGVEVATFALIHGAGDVGWYWHLVQAELGQRGHDTVAPDLPVTTTQLGSPSTPTPWPTRSATGPT
jgi:hypothetical protein